MDFFKAAFGGFSPHTDRDAAVKFALDVIAADNRLDELLDLLKEKGRVEGIGGEPGWLICRRDDGDNSPGYADWPAGAKFQASVNPEDYELEFPEGYYTRAEFISFVQTIVSAYVIRYPDRVETVAPLTGLIEKAAADQ